jgi:outer membrane receptor protein involved in Fe transport
MKNNKLRKQSVLAAIVTGAFLTISSAQAQQTSTPVLEEIVVTAAYREQGLQDVPISISAVTGDMIAATAIQKAEDIQFLVPNFTLTETGIGTNAFIRGIGSGINQAFEQSVGTYIDGVYFGRAQQWRMPFMDIQRVEVLRGPQSILFGKNSVAGALNISTAEPTSEFEARLSGSWEFADEESIIDAMVSGPISDRIRYRIAARARDLSGHMQNATLGTEEPNREDWNVRGILEFDITDNLTATLKAEVGEFDVTGRHIEIVNELPGGSGLTYSQVLVLAFGADSSVLNNVQDEVRSSNGDFSFNESENFVLTLDWGLGEYDFESITAMSNFDYDEFCDCDFTGAFVFGAALQESYEQFSQEFRLSSPVSEKFDYIAGLYYQTSEHDFADQIIVDANSILVPANGPAGALISDTQASRLAGVDNDVLSAFAQFNWHMTDGFTLQAGGRITNDQRDGFRTLSIVKTDGSALPAQQAAAPVVYGGGFGITSTNLVALAQVSPTAAALVYGVDGNGIPCSTVDPACMGGLGVLPVGGTRDKTTFSPEIKLIWDVGNDALLYLSWSEGFKSGSFDFRANNKNFYDTMEESFEFEDEEATNFEFGGKNTLADGTVEFNYAAYYTEFDNLQISQFDGILGFNVGNAASAETYGVEMDMRWAATEHLTISAGLALTEFDFSDFKNGQCYVGAIPTHSVNGVPLCDYTGNTNQMVSDYQGNLAFDLRIPVGRGLEIAALFDVFFTDDYYASATYDPGLIQEAYQRLNARIALGADTGRWEIALLAKNLSDEKILSFGGDTPLAGSSFGAKSNYAFFGTGRTLTMQGTVLF